MTELELIKEIEDALSFSCSLPYNLNQTEIARIIKRGRDYFYDNYQYAVERRVIVLGRAVFSHPEFRATRQIKLPDNIVTVYDVRETNGIGISGNPDRDFGDSKLLGSELLLSPFVGDNLVYRTVMYSYFDLARAYLLETFAFNWNKNNKKLTILGRDPNRVNASNPNGTYPGGVDVAIQCFVKITENALYDDELFVRYCIGKSKEALGNMLSVFDYNLPGGVRVNAQNIISQGKEEVQEVMTQIDGESSSGAFFLQWN
jgi:hypothetical protein